jgi:hypothetical protein
MDMDYFEGAVISSCYFEGAVTFKDTNKDFRFL